MVLPSLSDDNRDRVPQNDYTFSSERYCKMLVTRDGSVKVHCEERLLHITQCLPEAPSRV